MAERRSTDKIHIDKTIPIYQIVMILFIGVSTVVTYAVNQYGIDNAQNIEINKNIADIAAVKESQVDFQNNVLYRLKQINDRGDRSEEKQDEFVDILLNIYKELKDAKK